MREQLFTLWRGLVTYLSTMILATIMGLVAWLIIIELANPLITRDYAEAIPIEVSGLASDLMPVQDLSREIVRVELRAPELRWPEIEAADVRAYIDLEEYQIGAHEVPIHVETLAQDITVTSVDRRFLRIQLDEVMTKTVPVQAAVMDSAEYGYAWDTPVVEPTTVTVVGPAQQVNQVVVAEAPVFLRGATTSVERLQTVNLLSRLDQAVGNVSAQPAAVDIVIPVERWPGRRTVAVRVKLVGEPAFGYRLVRVTPDPSNVVLYGDADALDQVPGFIETAPLALNGAVNDVQSRLELLLPEGVNASDGNSVTVNAEIVPVEHGRTITLRPFVRGLGDNLAADFSPETVDVIISGPLASLTSLGPDDIFATLDVNGLPPGSHNIVPNIIGPNEIRSEGTLPETVEVVITSLVTEAVTETVGGGTIPSITVTPVPTRMISATATATPVAATSVAATPVAATQESRPPVRVTMSTVVTPTATRTPVP